MKKYDRPPQSIRSTQVSGEAIINKLNQQNITLLPFTFDVYGSMGPVATSYFYKDIYVPTITDKKILNKLPLPALKAYLKGGQNKKMISLFDSANKGWRLIHKDKWFGSTYQLTAPSNWGNHYLGMNINIALTQHLKRSFIVMDKTINVKAENKKYPILGRQSIAHHGTESNHRKTKSKIKQTVSSKTAKKTPHKHNTN